MIRKIICLFALANVGLVMAQDGTTSPYSFYGTGEQRFRGTNEIKDMGSLAVFTDSLHMNTLNPASYGQLQRATLSLGASYKSSDLKSNQNKSNTTSGSFDYITLSIPVGKLGVAFGVMPYSFAGYKVMNQTTSQNMTIQNLYEGDGAINRTFLGLGYKVNKNLSVGVDAAYLFGDITQNSIKFITNNGEGLALDRGTRNLLSNNYSGFDFNIAANYKHNIGGKNFLHVNGTFSPETKLSTDYTSTIDIIKANQEDYTVLESLEANQLNRDLINPMKYSFGLGVGNPFKWFLGAEYSYANTEATNKDYSYEFARFEDSQKFAIGGFYTPKYNSFTSYIQRTTFRGGFRYEKTGLLVNNENINDMAIHAGIGLPVGMYNSNLNLGLEFGKKGTKNNNLIQENYFSISIGLSLNDRWFEKRKFN